jgi:hypothetical protein
MNKLYGTAICKVRDELIKARHEKKITLKQIRERLTEVLAESKHSEIIQMQIVEMVEYRHYDRITCPVEQAMHDAVCNHIVKEIMKYRNNS